LNRNIERLGTDKIGKLLYEFSMPAIIGMLVNAVYNTVDRIYVGHGVDALGIAGISIAMPLMLVGTALNSSLSCRRALSVLRIRF
jgi:Na+-driven multidrug efflux pump